MIPAAQLAIARQEDGLSLLLGENPRAIERGLGFDSPRHHRGAGMVPAVALLRRRPDIAAAEAQLAASDHALDAARDAFMPDVQLAASGGLIGSNLASAVRSNIGRWAAASWRLSSVPAGWKRSRISPPPGATRRRSPIARPRLTAFREVEDALIAVQRNDEQERALSAQRDVQEHALRLATNRYRAGYSPYLDQIDAQRSLLSAQLALVQARADRLTALVSLYQSLGGGWKAPSPSNPQEAASP